MNAHTGKYGEFFQHVKDEVYKGKLKELNGFDYSCFKFKFNLNDEQYAKEFTNFLYYNNPLMPWDVCNFFHSRNIKFSIHFRYCKQMNFKSNFTLFKTVLFLKKETIRINIVRKYHKIICKIFS